jgi:hypothetical protein
MRYVACIRKRTGNEEDHEEDEAAQEALHDRRREVPAAELRRGTVEVQVQQVTAGAEAQRERQRRESARERSR